MTMIRGINDTFLPIPGVQESLKPKPTGTAEAGAQGGSFGDVLKNALKEVNSLQNDADTQIEGLTLKKDGVTPHSAMVALEKADIAFQLMSAVRSKIIRAYEEVIRTQV
jgi:flagellar hook-basal body complex protein FliE